MQAPPEARRMKPGTVYLPGLKRVRDEQQLSLQELSDMAGVSKDAIWHLETLRRAAEQRTRRKLAKALGVRVRELQMANEGEAIR